MITECIKHLNKQLREVEYFSLAICTMGSYTMQMTLTTEGVAG